MPDDCSTELSSILSIAYFHGFRIPRWDAPTYHQQYPIPPDLASVRLYSFDISTSFTFYFGNELDISNGSGNHGEPGGHGVSVSISLFSIRVCSAFSFVFWRNTHLSFYHFVAHRFEIFCLHLKRIRVFRTFSGILLFCIILSHFGSYKFLSFSFHINFPHDIGRLSRNRIGTDQQAGNILHCVVPMPQRGGSLGFTHAASYRVWYTYIGR